MTDYRDPNDPLRREPMYDPNVRSSNAAWGWIAGIVFLGIIVALAFGVGKSPNTNVANNTPPAATRMAPGPANPTFTPAPNNPMPANPAPAPSKP